MMQAVRRYWQQVGVESQEKHEEMLSLILIQNYMHKYRVNKRDPLHLNSLPYW